MGAFCVVVRVARRSRAQILGNPTFILKLLSMHPLPPCAKVGILGIDPLYPIPVSVTLSAPGEELFIPIPFYFTATRSFANGLAGANAKYSTAAAQSMPAGPQAAHSQGTLLQVGGDAMEAITKLSPELARELNKGYKIPDLVRLVRTKHPEANDIIKIMIMFMIADKRTIGEIAAADGINVMSEVIQTAGDNEDMRLNAVRLLGGMATDEKVRAKIAETDTVQRVAKHLLNAVSDEAILTLLMALRNFAGASRAAQEINEIPSMHRRISELLSKRFNEAINENAAGLVTNLSRERTYSTGLRLPWRAEDSQLFIFDRRVEEQKLAIARVGVVGSLGQLLDSQNVEVLRVVTQALRNLGHNGTACLSLFSISPLLSHLSESNLGVLFGRVQIRCSCIASKRPIS